MIAILSSAKTMDFTAVTPKIAGTKPVFKNEIRDLSLLLKQLSGKDLAKLMKLSPKLSDLNFQRYQSLDLTSEKNSRPAIFAYLGDVYQGLDATSLKVKDLEFAQDHLRIVSGLYGLLRPADLVQAYRLEMAIKLKNPIGKDLYAFWQQKVTQQLRQDLAKQKQKVLVNLASEEYSKVVLVRNFEFPVINVIFKQKAGRTLKNVGIFAKQARGLMARAILMNKWDKPEALQNFNCENYRFDNKLSDAQNFVFTRNWK